MTQYFTAQRMDSIYSHESPLIRNLATWVRFCKPLLGSSHLSCLCASVDHTWLQASLNAAPALLLFTNDVPVHPHCRESQGAIHYDHASFYAEVRHDIHPLFRTLSNSQTCLCAHGCPWSFLGSGLVAKGISVTHRGSM